GLVMKWRASLVGMLGGRPSASTLTRAARKNVRVQTLLHGVRSVSSGRRWVMDLCSRVLSFFFSSRRRHTRSYGDWSSDCALPISGKFLFGDAPTGADVCLIPQLYNARRFNVPLDAYPTLLRAEENANRLQAFVAASPDRRSEERRVGKEWRCRWGGERVGGSGLGG